MVWLDQGGFARHVTMLIRPRSSHPLVEHFWIQRWTGAPATWRVVPDTRPHLIFHLGYVHGRERSACHLVGARSRFADVDLGGRRLTIGARLRPGALPLLAGRPAFEITDSVLPLEAVAGREGRELLGRMAATDVDAALAALTTFLGRPRGLTGPLAGALERASTVASAAAHLGLTPRALHTQARDIVGLGPKRALRIGRLHRALRALSLGRPLVEAATDAGFSDQAHLTREFGLLLGESPVAWRRRGRQPLSAVSSGRSDSASPTR
jgi:AraC-like DNA-binding protein